MTLCLRRGKLLTKILLKSLVTQRTMTSAQLLWSLQTFFDEYAEVAYPLASNIKCFVRTAHAVLENPNDSDFNKIVALTDICIELGQDLDGVFLDGLNMLKPYAQQYDLSSIANAIRDIREFILVMNDGFAKTRDGINAVRGGE